jgi:hypothetical protein
MTVYILTTHSPYEGDTIHSAHATLDSAKRAANRTVWTDDDGCFVADQNGYDEYRIYAMKVTP